MISGALESGPPGFELTNLVLLVLIPKKDVTVDELFHVIADGWQMNEYVIPWKPKITGITASASKFIRGSYAFLRDFSSAYHNVPLNTPCNHQCAGYLPCRRAMEPHKVLRDLRQIVPADREAAASQPSAWRQSRFMGCRPGQNCNPNTCQK